MGNSWIDLIISASYYTYSGRILLNRPRCVYYLKKHYDDFNYWILFFSVGYSSCSYRRDFVNNIRAYIFMQFSSIYSERCCWKWPYLRIEFVRYILFDSQCPVIRTKYIYIAFRIRCSVQIVALSTARLGCGL